MKWSTLPVLLVVILHFSGQIRVTAGQDTNVRYILYDVNPGEGFNLRRDVFMRVAVFVKKLNQAKRGKFVLVLPPWGRLFHWQTRELGRQVKIPWKSFFDVNSIRRYVPAIELEEFLEREGPIIDTVLYLQSYKEGWEGNFEYKHDFRECLSENHPYVKEEEFFSGWFWDYEEIKARNFQCLSVQGPTSVIKDLILNDMGGQRAIMLDRAENLLHDYFGDAEYWMARRSMRFADDLVQVADEFREKFLSSNNAIDNTVISKKWEDHEAIREPRGGNYLCVHLRRNDYVYSRKKQIPSLTGAAEQVRNKLVDKGLTRVFVSTDASVEEFNEFKVALDDSFEVLKYTPDHETLLRVKDGGVAIIDQLICSRARTFLGTPESTFTFRIQEEREILGFPLEENFNMLCPDDKPHCEKASQWKIVYPPKKPRASFEDTKPTPEHLEL
ncbi:GDP-fucose protein O-fucosyltransferase 2-like [Tigriopus californicus]|uniref:GDP-fucose protein O-fucosyltransferase 2-like n=1 Tax=Tigriopus californicus TaxID=6832 RepID=UPI0027DA283C|nr:GDP-fucose protein O-fucosyltransferase 2-like [Tigriopus californicus]